MEPDRRLTAQGLERKQQLLDCAAELFAERGYAETRVIDIVPGGRRRQGPLLLVLREQGSAVQGAGRQHPAQPPARAGRGPARRRPAAREPLPGHRGVGAVHGRARPLLLAARGGGPQLHRRPAPGHPAAHQRHGPHHRGRSGRRHDPRGGPHAHGARRGGLGRPLLALPPHRPHLRAAAGAGRRSWPATSCTRWPPTSDAHPAPPLREVAAAATA